MRLLALVLLLAQEQVPPTPTAAPSGPAQADRAFAARAAEVGVNAAFLEVLAADAALFRPQPVEGRAWMQEHPDDGQLAWEPRAEVVSRAGDLGVTLGTYTYARDGATLSVGHYVSVWKREDEGPWRLLADIGAPHPAHAEALPYARVAREPWPEDAPAREPAEAEAFLRRVEGQLAELFAAGRDPSLATIFWADDHTVALRPGAAPAFGADRAEAEQRYAWQAGQAVQQGLSRLVVARGADLAVAWGELGPLRGGRPGGEAGSAQAAGGWLRGWSYDPRERAWRILVEVVLPPPQ